MKSRTTSAVVVTVAALLLGGCSAAIGAATGSQHSAASGHDAQAASGSGAGCSVYESAARKIAPGGISSPVQSDPETCVWGVGSHASASASELKNTLIDILSVNVDPSADDAHFEFTTIAGEPKNLTKIPGVGTEAVYYTGDTGVPQVVAYQDSKVCGTHLFVSDASVLGLTAPASGSQKVADADTPKLAVKVAALCTAAFRG